MARPKRSLGLTTIGSALVWIGCLAMPGVARAESEPITIPRAERPPVLADYVSGVPADAGLALSDFRQYVPSDGGPVSTPTTTYLSYDDKNLYAVFVIKDDPTKVRAHLSKREDVFQDDAVEILLDTFDDNQRAYVFYVNPYGVQLDAITTEGKGYDYDFDTLWYSDGRLTPDGWVTLISIPWKSLRFPRAPTQKWGFLLGRFNPRAGEFAYYPTLTRRIGTLIGQYGTMILPSEISPGRNFQLIPYAAANRARLLEDEGGTRGARYHTSDDSRIGVDAKLVYRDAVALDLTVKPDFSQVESDEPQVLVNQRFEVFFPEKRPFFLENATFFTLPINLFFSRRIAEPEYGARVTGKAGRWVFGGLAIDDVAPGQALPGSHDDRAGIGVVRVVREIGAQSNFGLFASSRSFDGATNSVMSLDGRWQINPNWSLTLQGAGSRAETAGDDLSGTAYSATLARQDIHWLYNGIYTDIDGDFRTDLGFVPRSDIRQLSQSVTYNFVPEGTPIATHGPTFFALGTWDHDGETQDWETTASYEVRLKAASVFSAGYTLAHERFLERDFSKHSFFVTASTEPFSWLNAYLSYRRGNAINFFPAPGLAPFLGDADTLTAQVVLKPGARLQLTETYIYTDLASHGAVSTVTDGERTVFVNNLVRSKVSYQFTRSLSLRAILDYQRLSPTASLVALEDNRRWVGDLLFTYLPNPGTALYVGYTENQAGVEILPTVPPSIVNDPDARTSVGRQVFVKVSYLFRY